MYNQVLPIVFLAAAVAASAQSRDGRGGPPDARFLSAEAGMPGPLVKGAPYSADAVTETTQILPDGNRIRQVSTVHVYRDSEGRTRREQALNAIGGVVSNSNLPTVVFINDPVTGLNYALSPRDKVATKSVWDRSHQPPNNDPSQQMGRGPNFDRERGRGGADNASGRGNPFGGAAVKTEALGKQTIDGLSCEGKRTTVTIPAGRIGNELPLQVVSETWYSPELHTVVMSKRSDPRMGETTFRLANISRADPPKALFEVPADFKVLEQRGGRGGQIKQ
jgi:hypothetical protein